MALAVEREALLQVRSDQGVVRHGLLARTDQMVALKPVRPDPGASWCVHCLALLVLVGGCVEPGLVLWAEQLGLVLTPQHPQDGPYDRDALKPRVFTAIRVPSIPHSPMTLRDRGTARDPLSPSSYRC